MPVVAGAASPVPTGSAIESMYGSCVADGAARGRLGRSAKAGKAIGTLEGTVGVCGGNDVPLRALFFSPRFGL